MSKKTLSLIIGLLLLTIALLTIALTSNNAVPTLSTKKIAHSITPTPVAQSTLSLSPANLVVNPLIASRSALNINIDASNDVTGVQMELSFDPSLLKNVNIVPGNFFTNPLVLLKNINQKDGRVLYILAITPSQEPRKGTGTVATLTFTPNAFATGSANKITEVKFLPKTVITARGIGASVLKSALPAQVRFGATTPSGQMPR